MSSRQTRRFFGRSRSNGRNLIEGLESRNLFSITVTAGGVTTQYSEIEPAIDPSGAGIIKRRPAGSDGAPGFQITLAFTGGLTASQQAVFTQAAHTWESIITADIPDVNTSQFGLIDDVRIQASGQAIDGVGKILGSAGPTNIRPDTGLTYAGTMQFDTADLASLETSGMLDEVITHEMGHVLGIGSLWPTFGLVTGSIASGGTNPQFIGPAALAEYKALAGDLSLTGVPAENTGGAGTQDAHWRESGVGSLGNELMTGFLNSSMANPLSRISAASLIDLGYPGVNVDATDLYTLPRNPQGDYSATNPLPTVGILSAASSTESSASSFALTLSSASDNAAVGSVSFYRESNGIPGLQASGTDTLDTLVATNAGGSNLTATVPAGLAPGSYTFYARAADNFGALSAVAQSSAIGVVAGPITPSLPTLAAGFDTGDSSSDGITKLNVLTFNGTAAPNATITLRSNGSTTMGTGTANGSGNYSVSTNALPDGTFSVTAIADSSAGTSASSAARTITVDTVAPTVVSSVYDRETTQAISLALSDALAARLTTSSVTLQNLTTSTVIPNTTVVVSGGGMIATFDRPAQLVDGIYRLTLPAGGLTDVAGNSLAAPAVLTFRQLAGDANNDGVVSFDDLVTVAQNYNTAGKTFSGGNFDYSTDGVVDFNDLVILAQNYNKTLALPASVSLPAPGFVVAPPAAKAKRGGNAAAVLA